MPRLFSPTAVGNLVAAQNWIFDSGQVSTDGWTTGMWRAQTPADSQVTIDSINISGINVAVDQLETITTSGVRAVTNNFSIITGSQLTLPIGTRSWSFAVVSGQAWVNGTGGIDAGYGLSSENYSANAINIGATGAGAASAKVLVQWEI